MFKVNKKTLLITKKQKNILYTVIVILLFTVGLIILLKTLFTYMDGITEAKKLKSLYEQGQETSSAIVQPSYEEQAPANEAAEPANDSQDTSVSEDKKTILPRYYELLKVNSEVIGWIKVDGTRIDYPLLKHDDNEYYLHTSIEGKKSKRGCVYMDFRNDSNLSDKNTLVYGHNMKDGSMFRDLVAYKKKSFFEAHRKILIDNLYEEGIWEVFSVYIVDANKETINIDYPDDTSFLNAMEGFKNRSMFETDTQIGKDDKIVTLVTCSYETSNARTIVHAKYIGSK